MDGKGDFLARATRYCEEVLPIMGEVRRYADLLETRVADDLWDLPSYQEILYGKSLTAEKNCDFLRKELLTNRIISMSCTFSNICFRTFWWRASQCTGDVQA